jgi:maltose alpha-D-glucosyltransferase/alpha-amylase
LWYKDAIIYELHVKAFHDSNGNGIGDLGGLIEKLDYLQGLGVSVIWLLPFYPSPLRDDGYDISDYFNINPDYGTLQDFRTFMKEAHRRGMRVLTELVVNHTSDQHMWFQQARRAKPGSPLRDYYVWSDTPEKYQEARIIFKDFETSNWSWDPIAKAYYWHRFYSHQPDLNYENPRVHKEIFRVVDFWLGMGVDGLRLDAVPYLFEREGTNCENLPETYDFLRKLRQHVDKTFKHRVLLAEANQWPEDAAAYFGGGDMCHTAFHFPVMPRMFMALRMEDRFPIIDILEQTPIIPDTCQWAMFLRNHDELTLEMVTDEERDYMYRVYARDPRAKINLGIRRRLAPLLDNNRRKIELMNILLFSLPGAPVIYYGDEIGMGDNYYLGDRDGIRTPMQWSPDRNAGFSKSNPHKLFLPLIIDPEYHHEAINVETQERNLSSLLWWMKRVIAMRRRFKAFGRGTLEFLSADNPKVLAFVRQYQDETIIVLVNLSRYSQVVEIDLSEYANRVPIEVFSQNRFPVIRESRYVVTLGPYDHYWLLLEQEREKVSAGDDRNIPEIRALPNWDSLVGKTQIRLLEGEVLEGFLRRARWFGGKSRTISAVKILEALPLAKEGEVYQLTLVEVTYTEGVPELYLIPLALSDKQKAVPILEEAPQALIARVNSTQGEFVLLDAVYDQNFRDMLLAMFMKKRRVRANGSMLLPEPGRLLRTLIASDVPIANSRVTRAEQSNTSINFDNKLFLKLYRRIEPGINPDPECARFITDKTDFSNIAAFAGSVDLIRGDGEPFTIALLQSFVPNQGDAWSYTIDALDRYFDRVLGSGKQLSDVPQSGGSLFQTDVNKVPEVLEELMAGFYFEMTRLLGRRTAELHLALASSKEDESFGPEPFSMHYQRSVCQSMRSQLKRVIQLLGSNLDRLEPDTASAARQVLTLDQDILAWFARILDHKISATKIRIHGDYHLGQVLFTGKDFVITDFEGEPARPIGERRLKRSPLRDVAGMIRSFHYAAQSALLRVKSTRSDEVAVLRPWVEPWVRHVSGVFLNSYLEMTRQATFLPTDQNDLELLLQVFLLDKAVYELGYELNNRLDWVSIPINGLLSCLQNRPDTV